MKNDWLSILTVGFLKRFLAMYYEEKSKELGLQKASSGKRDIFLV